MQKIIFDTDLGNDINDAICLAFLLRQPFCQLMGITTVTTGSAQRAALAEILCQAANIDIPIAAGLEESLLAPDFILNPQTNEMLLNLPHATYTSGNVTSFLADIIRKNPGEVTILATGPLTNLAALLEEAPDCVALLKGIYTAGGYRGLVPIQKSYYNWNFWTDPISTRRVVAARVRKNRYFPLDLTSQLVLPWEERAKWFDLYDPLIIRLMEVGAPWLSAGGPITLFGTLPAMCLFHRDICTYERGLIRVDASNGSSRGFTSFTPHPQGAAEMAVTLDKELFFRFFRKCFWRQKSPFAPDEIHADAQ